MELDLSDSNVKHLRDLSTRAWKTILLDFNEIPHIHWDNFPISLTKLSINHNELKHIDIDMPFPSLETLLLNRNYIRSFRMDGILSSLQTLDLSKNYIGDTQFLLCMPSLKHLNLSYNNIEILRDLPSTLETLDARHCRIKMVQSRLPSMLEELNLSHNCLKQGSTPLAWGTRLRILNLSFNHLKSFPKKLPDSLEWISIAGNRVEEFPEKLPMCMKTVIVNENKIRSLPLGMNIRLDLLMANSNRLTQDFHRSPITWANTFWAEDNWNDLEHHRMQPLVKKCWKHYLLKKRLRHIYRARRVYDELLLVALHPDHILQTDVFSPEWFKSKP
jgi:Leucine-rich repeat (LRR) protein